MTFLVSQDRRDSPAAVAQSRRWEQISCIGLAALFLYLFFFHLHHESRGDGWHLGDFPTFYIAAQYARAHRDIYTAANGRDMTYVYPPLIAFLYTPLTLLPVRQAAKISLLLNTLFLLASALLASRVMLDRLAVGGRRLFWSAALIASLLSLNEIRAVLTMLETDAIMLVVFTLALVWIDERPTWSGLALAIGMNIKYLPIIALPWLLVRQRWKASASMVVGTVGLALLPALLLGWDENLRCLRVSTGGLLRWFGISPAASHSIRVHDIRDDLSVSITSMLGRLPFAMGWSHLAVLAATGLVGCLVFIVVFRMYAARRFIFWRWPQPSRQRDFPYWGLVGLEWAGLIAAVLSFSPDTNMRHLVLTVIVNALAAVLILTSPPRIRMTAIAGATLILLCYIMPFGKKDTPLHFFYFRYGFPGWGLLIGYLTILWAGLNQLSTAAGRAAET